MRGPPRAAGEGASGAETSPSHARFDHSADEIAKLLARPPVSLPGARLARRWPARHSELLEFEGDGRRLLVKRIVRSRSAEVAAGTVRREFEALALVRQSLGTVGASVPEPLALIPELHAIVLSRIEGDTLAALLRRRGNLLLAPVAARGLGEVAARVGAWLREFHRLTAEEPVPFEGVDFLEQIRPALDRCGRTTKTNDAYVAIERRLAELASMLEGAPQPAAARHGDFIPQNVLVAGSSIGVVDFESFRERDAVYHDLASFGAYLALLQANPLYDRDTIRRVEERFLEGYGGVDPSFFALYKMHAAVRHAAEVDVTTPRGERRRMRFDVQLFQLSDQARRSVLQGARAKQESQ